MPELIDTSVLETAENQEVEPYLPHLSPSLKGHACTVNILRGMGQRGGELQNKY